MFLACWLCRSNANAFVICYHVLVTQCSRWIISSSYMFANVIGLLTSSMNVIGSTRWIPISFNNTPLRQISSWIATIKHFNTRQHPMFRDALILLIIDLRLSGSRTAWLYYSSTTSSLSLTGIFTRVSSMGSMFSLNTSSTAAISFHLTSQTHFLIYVR